VRRALNAGAVNSKILRANCWRCWCPAWPRSPQTNQEDPSDPSDPNDPSDQATPACRLHGSEWQRRRSKPPYQALPGSSVESVEIRMAQYGTGRSRKCKTFGSKHFNGRTKIWALQLVGKAMLEW